MRRREARVLTVGVYGTNASNFFASLEDAGADILLDIRRRRAVRGPRYTFANARRLIAGLAQRSIAYRHIIDLAPDREMLALQHAADAGARILLSQRTELAPEYLARYVPQILDRFDFDALATTLAGFRAPVLFCIERIPQACHRSLVAPRLARALAIDDVIHLIPQQAQ